MFELMTDLVRFIHLLCFAIGIGSAVFLESVVLSRARIRIDLEELALIEKGHKLIFIALTGLWVTGLILIVIRTSLDMAAFTPKLMAKLAVVGVLTINSMIIARWINPLLNNLVYRQLKDLGFVRLCAVGASVGLSAAGWLGALLLGSISLMKTLPGDTLALLYGGLMIGGAIVGCILSLIAARPEAQQETAISRLQTKHDNPPRARGDDTIDMALKETIYAQPIHRP